MASTISKPWSPSGPNSDVFERHADCFELTRADKSNEDTVPLDPCRAGYSREFVPLDAAFIDQLYAWIKRKKEQVGITPETARVSESSISPENVYKPIKDPYEVRVLEIQPGEFNDPLRASLAHCTLEFEYQPIPLETKTGSDGPHRTGETRYALSMGLERLVFYTALSYTWGTGRPDATIVCDGQPLGITISLETALRHFRRKDHAIVMWIDQICIDQKNGKEKEQQIPLMSRIYSHALNTAIWLGAGLDEPTTNNSDDDDSSDLDATTTAFALLRQIHARFRFHTDTVSTPADLLRLRLPPITSSVWLHLRALFALPWFARLWVIQELILSRSPWMVLGTHSNANAPDILAMPYNDFSNACYAIVESGLHRFLSLHSDDDGAALAGCETLYKLDGKRLAYSSFQEPPGLFAMLVATRYAACSVSQDKVYGLLGICGRAARDIGIDYDRGAGEVYREVAVMFLDDAVAELEKAKEAEYDADLSLHRRGVFDVLICVDRGPVGEGEKGEGEKGDMPSWCPDWRRDRVTEALGLATSTASFYKAGGGADPRLVVGVGGRELRVEGKVFDVVGEVSDVFAEPHLGLPAEVGRESDLLACLEVVRRCYPCSGKCACQDRCKYASGCGIFEAF
ncbi:Heterokaryon incompatibility protein [Lasiodiplodia theobromae]|uniref:Heterokaryon incompatibility protein n=1 Tax=Lasiodiplodia theobromae TaxID=45133 RepID=UPI0015C39EF6|nr:Heterokaryon incompatibility protein [Lasiodiplodia theobromae]KAF4544522.1 Heterokaryon incompatibility protein [Lasiodiplodia theobromae]